LSIATGVSSACSNVSRDGNGHETVEELGATVTGSETLTLAGTPLTCLVIEQLGSWRLPGLGETGRLDHRYWFSPQAKRWVRREFRSYSRRNVIEVQRLETLTQFSIG